MNRVIYISLSSLIVMSDFLRNALSFSLLDKALIIAPLALSFLAYISTRRQYTNFIKGYISIIFIYLIASVAFMYSSFYSFLYELFRLFSYLAFIPLFSILNKSERKDFISCFITISLLFYSINLLIIFLQVLLGPQIVGVFNLNYEMYYTTSKAGRYMGLFSNLPSLSLPLLFMVILSDYMIKNNNEGKIIRKTRWLKYIAIFTIVLSTSKIALLALIIYYLIKYKHRINNTLFVSLLFIFIPVIFFLLSFDPRMINKYDQITFLLNSDELLNEYGSGAIDWRFENIVLSLRIFSENIFGLGLGTWGDFSATFNANPIGYPIVTMSDSATSHHLAEQGIFVALYYMILCYPGFKSSNIHIRYYAFLPIIFFVASMGFSDSIVSLVYSLVLSYLVFEEKSNENTSCQ